MKKLIRLFVIPLAFTPVAIIFQNCGQAGQITASDSQQIFSADPVTLISSPSLIIDGGAEHTNSKNVMLQLSALGAEEMLVSDNSNCDSNSGWERFSETKPWVLSEENKFSKVYVKYRKKGAPETSCISDEILHDSIAPVLTVVAKPAAYTKELVAQLKYQAVDNGSGIRDLLCRDQANQEEKCTEIYNFKDLSKEQTLSVTVTAIDKAGNVSIPLVVALVIDRTPPVVTINGPTGATANPAAQFKLTIMDASKLSFVQCRLLPLEANFKNCTDLKADYANLASGLYTFEARAEDLAGNLGQARQSFEVDRSVPSVMLTRTPVAIGSQKNVSFEFRGLSGAKPINLFKCSLDRAAYTACTSALNLSNLADKEYNFKVIGTNSVGVDSSPAEHKFIVDTLAPELKIVSSPKGTIKINQASVTLSASDLNGLKSLECSLNGAAFTDCSSRIVNYTGLADGSYSFAAKATDNAGNVTQVGPVMWSVDTTPDSQILANFSTDPTLEGLTTMLQVQTTSVKNLSYSCLGKYSKAEIAKGTSTLAAFNSPVLVNEDFSCDVKGLDKANLEIKRTVQGVVNCGNRIKDQGRCIDFKCSKFTVINLAAGSTSINIPSRSEGECFSIKLFDAIQNSSSKLTTLKDLEVISSNHDSNSPQIHNPYVLGSAKINFKLGGPRVVKLSGGANSTSPILVDNFVVSGIFPAKVTPQASHYSAHGTKDSTVDTNRTHILLKDSPIQLKAFASGGTASVAPLEIVKEADTNLDYILDIRALDCGGSRELSEVHLLFQ